MVEADGRRVERAVDKIPTRVLRDVARKGKVGASRSMAKVLSSLPVAPILCADRAACWRYLAAVASVPLAKDEEATAPDLQPAIVVRGIFINTDGRPGIRHDNFWLCVTRHAIGRLLDRSGGKVDVIKALYSAHDRVMGLAMSDAGQDAFATPDVLVPASGGMFLAQCRRIGPMQTITAIARTWVDEGQAYDDQLERARMVEGLTWP
jgi:hypothetical protein